jgi:small subunit ribosomal protein S6
MSVHEYEVTFIVDPTLGEEETVGVAERVTQTIAGRGGMVSDISPWGKRRLAYPINHMREGSYVTITFDMDTAREVELEPAINLMEPVMRHVIVRLDERKKARDQRARAAAQRAAAAAQHAAAQHATAGAQAHAAPAGAGSTVGTDAAGGVDAAPSVVDDEAEEFVPPAVADDDVDEEEA